jgi:hypothetical protein
MPKETTDSLVLEPPRVEIADFHSSKKKKQFDSLVHKKKTGWIDSAHSLQKGESKNRGNVRGFVPSDSVLVARVAFPEPIILDRALHICPLKTLL